MPRSSRDEEFSAFVQTRRTGLVRSACLLTAGAFPDGLAGGEVRAALAALPSGMRAAIVPRHWLDLSAGETAELLNCPEDTVKSQPAKATARLQAGAESGATWMAAAGRPSRYARTSAGPDSSADRATAS